MSNICLTESTIWRIKRRSLRRKSKKLKLTQHVFIKSKMIKLCSYRPRLLMNRCIRRRSRFRRKSEKSSAKKAKLSSRSRRKTDWRRWRESATGKRPKGLERSISMVMIRLPSLIITIASRRPSVRRRMSDSRSAS